MKRLTRHALGMTAGLALLAGCAKKEEAPPPAAPAQTVIPKTQVEAVAKQASTQADAAAEEARKLAAAAQVEAERLAALKQAEAQEKLKAAQDVQARIVAMMADAKQFMDAKDWARVLPLIQNLLKMPELSGDQRTTLQKWLGTAQTALAAATGNVDKAAAEKQAQEAVGGMLNKFAK